jgi:uncharacterized protein YbjT (DUF2867 family)
MRTAIIAGASGLIGKQLMYKLLENSQYSKVSILVRKPLEIKHPKLEQIHVDFSQIDKMPTEGKFTDAFCCLGTTINKAGSKDKFYEVDFTFVHTFAQHFSNQGTENFLLVSANGADKNSSIFYSKVKGEIEEAIKKVSFKGIYIFRPSILLGDREEFRLGEKIGIVLAMVLSPLLMGSLKKYKPIHSSKVADGMIANALSNKEGVFILESDEI